MLRKIIEKLMNRHVSLKTRIVATPLDLSSPPSSIKQIDFEKRLIKNIEKSLSEYHFIKKEKIPFLAKLIINNNINNSKNILSLDEKKFLKLNARSKYSREFIDCFENVSSMNVDPKLFCGNLKHSERCILWSLDKIEECRKKKFIKKVALTGKGDWDNKEYDINKIPPMPKIDYTEEAVLFFVIPKIDLNHD